MNGENKSTNTLLHLLLLSITLCACATPTPAPTPTVSPLSCGGTGSLGSDRVPNPTQGFDISFQYYLPPCYESETQSSYPVLYLIAVGEEKELSPTDNTPMSLSERLIRSGRMKPVIIIAPRLEIGYGSDAALTKDLIPYVDGKFRTLRERGQREVGGISHGAAIAARMAFQFPEIFGSVGLLSGGLADGERERFEGWVQRTPQNLWPRVRIDVGDQDAIMRLTSNLLAILDRHHVPYLLNVKPGNHDWTFWSAQMESYLLWMAGDGK